MQTPIVPRRVVVTGMGAISPLGRGVNALFAGLKHGKSGIVHVEDMAQVGGMGPRIAGLVQGVDVTEVPRKLRRSMSRMSVYAFMAAQEAIAQAGLEDAMLHGGETGLAIGSTIGSAENLEFFFNQYLATHSIEQIKSMLFFRIMGHTIAANLAQAIGITGRVIAPAAACSTSCQAIGLAYETIAFGKQNYMLAGGADEFHALTAATFDIMKAASTGYNETPQDAPRPFDKDRDGIVCAEGAGILVLEAYDSAIKRKAPILAEIRGFATTGDPSSIANPDPYPVYNCMNLALQNAHLLPEDISYVNAHATGTPQGDAAESTAIHMLFGNTTPVSSLKGHLGHTMAASGALESIASICMMQKNILIPTKNLDTPGQDCSGVLHVPTNDAQLVHTIMKNNFALGGINCSLIFGKP
ncbi:beta-ketoacyl-ACP synthase [Desulfovibrionales bacterium]